MWLSFDLGLRGDYEGICTWLDEHGAKECGDNVAYLKYKVNGTLPDSLKADLDSAIEVTKKTRIYVVWAGEDGKTHARFIIGRRKSPPWAGSSGSEGESESDEG
jgi:hypothetical protein